MSADWDLSELDFPSPRHALLCPVWVSPDPADVCTCDGGEPPTTAERIARICPLDENGEAL